MSSSASLIEEQQAQTVRTPGPCSPAYSRTAAHGWILDQVPVPRIQPQRVEYGKVHWMPIHRVLRSFNHPWTASQQVHLRNVILIYVALRRAC